MNADAIVGTLGILGSLAVFLLILRLRIDE